MEIFPIVIASLDRRENLIFNKINVIIFIEKKKSANRQEYKGGRDLGKV